MNYIPGQFLPISLTGSTLVDGIIGYILSSMMFHILGDYDYHLNTFISWLGIYHTKKTLTIYKFTTDEDDNNCFWAVRHYLDRGIISSRFSHIVVECGKGTDIELEIRSDTMVPIEFREKTLYIKYKKVHEKDAIEDSHFIIFTYSSSNEILKEFVRHCVFTYETHIKNTTWKPSRFLFVDRWSGTTIRNTRNYSNVILDKSLKTRIQKDIQNFYNKENWYTTRGIPWTRGFLLYGTPGTGKTSLLKAISNESRLDIYSMCLSQITSDTDLQKAFHKLPEKCMLVLEDIDCMSNITQSRENSTSNHNFKSSPSGLTLSCLLNELDGISNAHGRLVIMTTNHIEKLDPALIRPGRVDMKIHLQECSKEMIYDFYRLMYQEEFPDEYKSKVRSGVIIPATLSNLFSTNPKSVAISELLTKFT